MGSYKSKVLLLKFKLIIVKSSILVYTDIEVKMNKLDYVKSTLTAKGIDFEVQNSTNPKESSKTVIYEDQIQKTDPEVLASLFSLMLDNKKVE